MIADAAAKYASSITEEQALAESQHDIAYRSLHLIVSVPIFLSNHKRMMKVEVQIHTVAMDSWASLEHQLRYKKDIDNTDEIENELLTCAELSRELDTRMNDLRKIIISGE